MDLNGQSLISTKQFDRDSLLEFFEFVRKTENILDSGAKSEILNGKILATLFYEPSTRTRFSFEIAMLRLGGTVVSNADMMTTSSAKKLESLSDTAKVVSQMVDIIVMRHPAAGSVEEFSSNSDVPVVNAGDGVNEHPTQALLDVYTIWKEKGSLDGLTVLLLGDLKNGRVPHSQYDLLKHFDVNFIFVSPKGLEMPGHDCVDDLESVVSEADVIACTRIQKERFDDLSDYEKYSGAYKIDKALMKMLKPDAIVLHPLPRVDEISPEVDSDPRAKYFNQVRNGVVVRMALYLKILNYE